MTDLEKACENALYEEIRVPEDGKSVVRDVPTGKLYFKKRLDVYNEQVYKYLRDHKNRNVSAVQAFWKDGDELVVIEELIQGRTLEEILGGRPEEMPGGSSPDAAGAEAASGDAGASLPFSERINILTQICEGLQFLHSADPPIIHRDIKASNIMVTDDGVVKIIDYDAAKVYVAGQKKDTELIGTQGLAAPEQYGFAQSDVRTDLYALGKLIERMLPDNPDAKNIADKATEMDPKKRYTSAEQMKGQILRIRENPSGLDQSLEKIPGFDPMNKSHRIRARVGLALALAALIALAGFLGWRYVIYPAQLAEQAGTELAAISSMDAGDGEIVNSVAAFAQAYPYNSMKAEQKESVRNCMADVMKRCFDADKAEYAPQVRDVLIKYYGEEETWNALYDSEDADYNLAKGNYEEALAKLHGILGSGVVNAEDRWKTTVSSVLEAARQNMDAFIQTSDKKKLPPAVKDYNILISYDADIPDTDVQAELNGKVEEAIALAQSDRSEKKWDEAIEIYKALKNTGVCEGDKGVQVNLDELITEASYEKAEELYAKGSYKAASDEYGDLGDYKDSRDKFTDSIYRYAVSEKENGNYSHAIDLFETIKEYQDSGDQIMEAKYSYCEDTCESPDNKTYKYILELVDADYDGAQDLQNEVYRWRVGEIQQGILYSLGASQNAYFKVTLAGGPPDGTAVVLFKLHDYTTGEDMQWSDEKEYRQGETAETNVYEDNPNYSLFDRTFRVRVYMNGDLVETWEGQFDG